MPFAGAFLLAGAVGCGDDDGPSNVDANTAIDASTIDGAPDIDAGCSGGHGEDCVDSIFALPEHGEFRLELFQTGPSGEGDESRLAAQAFFFTDQEPALRTIGGLPITIRQELVDQGYACLDMSPGDRFDNGGTPEAQAIVDTRTYLDVGASATMTNVADETEVITLNKHERSADPALATDFSANLIHNILYQADDTIEASLATQYKVGVAGSVAYELDLVAGESAFTAIAPVEPLIYMPSNFQITEPTEADFYAAAGMTFTKNQDFEIKYTIDDPEDVGNGHPTIIPFVGFVKNREIQAYCLKFSPNVIDDGTFIVPYEVFEVVDQDPAAAEETSYFEFGRFNHTAWETGNLATTSRIDILGINCALSPDWVVEEAAAP
jgi:hypothetical protein